MTVPVKHRAAVATGALIVVAWGAGLATVVGYKTHVVTHTRVTHVTVSYGKPSQTVSAATVNPQLSQLGMTACDVYASRRTMVCHP